MGRAILVNAITYIVRFTDDRPIMEAPLPFAGREFLTRDRMEVLIVGKIEAGGIIWQATSTSGSLPHPA